MKSVLIATAVLALAGAAAPAALADEVIIHRDAPVVVDPAPAPSETTTTVEKHEHADGCASKTVHQENDVGDSRTVHTENCD